MDLMVDVMAAMLGDRQAPRLVAVDGQIKIQNWRNEIDLRKQLARLAHLYGWNVSEEVVVPGWGRIDIVLEDEDLPNKPILIELKLEIRRPSEARKAFQQIDGYGRWWKATRNQGAELVLCVVDHEPAVTRPVADAYPEVSLHSAGEVMAFLPHWRTPADVRWAAARDRLADARKTLALHEQAVADIVQIESRS
ncbi:hypothetical protein ACQP1P_38870 [Dactylosporangium sp. CA-052675]|uniref:hypothetical protein n=1 Tax=Dactylosporangium sp. CA-052675 TaxID=3239927 RepID=UPI003D8B384C